MAEAFEQSKENKPLKTVNFSDQTREIIFKLDTGSLTSEDDPALAKAYQEVLDQQARADAMVNILKFRQKDSLDAIKNSQEIITKKNAQLEILKLMLKDDPVKKKIATDAIESANKEIDSQKKNLQKGARELRIYRGDLETLTDLEERLSKVVSYYAKANALQELYDHYDASLGQSKTAKDAGFFLGLNNRVRIKLLDFIDDPEFSNATSKLLTPENAKAVKDVSSLAERNTKISALTLERSESLLKALKDYLIMATKQQQIQEASLKSYKDNRAEDLSGAVNGKVNLLHIENLIKTVTGMVAELESALTKLKAQSP